MNTKKYSIFSLASLLIWFTFLPVAQASVLQDFNGQAKSIDDYAGKGKWLVVMIWASDCLICNKEAHAYVDFHFTHADEDAEVLGISMDGQANKGAALKFIEEHKINFPNLIGEPEEVAYMFNQLTGNYFAGTPAFLIYDPTGKLRVQQLGAVPPELIEEYIKQNTAVSK